MRSDSFLVRALAAFLVGTSAPGSILAASHYGASPGYWLIVIPCIVLIAAILVGYFEPFAKRVWIHALLLMLPELVALPVAILTCKGHGCVASRCLPCSCDPLYICSHRGVVCRVFHSAEANLTHPWSSRLRLRFK